MSADPSTPDITIPADLLPGDGRFGCGPSKVRPEAVAALAAAAPDYLGTSHRQDTVRFKVSELRNGLAELFALPDGYEIILGNGGTTAFWDAMTFGLIQERSQHLSFGEFSSKFAKAAADAPHLADPVVDKTDPGTHPRPRRRGAASTYCAHPQRDLHRRRHAAAPPGGLLGRRRTSSPSTPPRRPVACASTRTRSTATTSPRRRASPPTAACGWPRCRPRPSSASSASPPRDRWVPASLDLGIALENSRKDQTYNTPALATVFLAVEQVKWMNDNGGLEFAAGRSRQVGRDHVRVGRRVALRDAVRRRPRRAQPRRRHHRPRRLDHAATVVSDVLRANGVVDTDSYRKLGRNQLRVAMFPAIDPDRRRRPHRLHRLRRRPARLTHPRRRRSPGPVPTGSWHARRSRRGHGSVDFGRGPSLAARTRHADRASAPDRRTCPHVVEPGTSVQGGSSADQCRGARPADRSGGMFEVVTETVDGIEMRCTRTACRSLRSVAEVAAAARRRPDVHRLRRPHASASPSSSALANGVADALARPLRPRPGRPGRGAVAEQPRVVPRLLGHGQQRRHPRRPQRLVDDRRDRLRPAGLRRQGARRRPQALRADRRITSTQAPDLEHVFLDRLPTRPTSAGRRPARCTASTSSPASPDRRLRRRRRSTRTTTR